MNQIGTAHSDTSRKRTPLVEIARELGRVFAERAKQTADDDEFVHDNFEMLKTSGLVEAGVPAALGGGGATIDELAAMLRVLGYPVSYTHLTLPTKA